MNMHPCWLTQSPALVHTLELLRYINLYTIVWHILMHNTHTHVQYMWHTINQSDDDTLLHHTLLHARDLFHLTVCIFEWVYVLSFYTTLLVVPLHCCRSIPYNNSHMYISMSYMQRPIGLDDCTWIVCS